ncbi:hypothetical protein GLAREA_03689 [Glarea lozoyensis ATCC 20868]|uniref:Uncharacterized protein n=1 Tax=Glarea lozoyensis (strain ATCC 20868 / MF5171) TaxID=1116229 RepID=S3CWH2_GLAL2|nr:uncharacterized protein GLAREA_03689 [Glarea lozoyensis ATCC 20868]EPE30722.1 hypothetical protein GLAREA_03689 [Glarea lozoyensis ATCC 20868]
MLAKLQLIAALQVFGVYASGFADIVLREVLLPRSPAPGLVGDAVNVFNGKRGIEARQAPASACGTVLDAISICESFSPGFLTFAPSSQAPCLCYSSGTWNPNFFDGAISTCVSYAKSASPTDYSAIAELNGFCTSVGNVRAATASLSASTIRLTGTPTASSTTISSATSASASSTSPTITSRPKTTSSLDSNPGCSTVSRLIDSCSSATRGFTDARVASQAACLCYSSSTWSPDNFDDGVRTCAEYVRTADPTDYSIFTALSGFCTSAGDVLAAVTVPTTRAPLTGNPNSPTVTGTPNTAAANGGGAVTVTAGAGQTNPPASGAGANRWNGVLSGVLAVAVSAVWFL